MRSAMPRFTRRGAARLPRRTIRPTRCSSRCPTTCPPVIAATAAEVTAGAADRRSTGWWCSRTGSARRSRTPPRSPTGHGSSAIVNFLENRVGLLRAVLRDVRGDGQDARHPVAGGRRVHAGRARTTTAAFRCWAATPTRGRRCGSTGYGWVPFEPTPGRGMPGAEAYTGIPPDQDTGEPPATTTTTTTTTLPPTTTTLAGQTPPPPGRRPRRCRRPRSHDAAPGSTVRQPVVPVAARPRIGARSWRSRSPCPSLVRRWRRRRRGPSTDPAHAAARAVGPSARRPGRDRVPRRSGADPDRGVRPGRGGVPVGRRTAAPARRRGHRGVVRAAGRRRPGRRRPAWTAAGRQRSARLVRDDRERRRVSRRAPRTTRRTTGARYVEAAVVDS